MNKYFILIFIITSLYRVCLSTHDCNTTISGGTLSFLCPTSTNPEDLYVYNLTVAQLDNITSIVVRTAVVATSTTPSPFTSLSPNLCLFRNLQTIDYEFHQIANADPTGALTSCLPNVATLDLSNNRLTSFPSAMIYNMANLKNLYFRNNLLTEVPVTAFRDVTQLEVIDFSFNRLTTFELWALDVKTKADFSNNNISTITNKYFYINSGNMSIAYNVSLTGNFATISLTDAVYEMYDQCGEVVQWYSATDNVSQPFFTQKLASIYFGTSRIDCSCDQAFILRMLYNGGYLAQNLSITKTLCSGASPTGENVFFTQSSCSNSLVEFNSTVNFTQVYPRLCKLFETDANNLTSIPNINPPSLNVSNYTHYESAFMTPGACFYIFPNTSSVRLKCTIDISNTESRIPKNLLSSPYMAQITRVTYPTPISSFPSYLCELPSKEIDLSYQAFTTLNDATFPCLDSFNKVTLSFNQLTSVNMASGNFSNLNYLDLSSNGLTMLPYSILRPTPTSLRYLDLRNNSINYIDLFLFTLKNITVNLDRNPINASNIINPQNVTITLDGNSTANITFPVNVNESTTVIDDNIAVTYGSCNNFQNLRNSIISLKSISRVQLKCTCESFNLRNIYQQNRLNVTNDVPCPSDTQAISFYLLTTADCRNSINFTAGLCGDVTTTTSAPGGGGGATTPPNSLQNSQSSNNTPLIVGLVVGLVGGLLLLAAIAGGVAFYMKKRKDKKAGSGKKKRVANTQDKRNNLQSHLSTKPTRSIKLPPISNQTAPLPPVPVAKMAPLSKATPLSYGNVASNVPTRGIPLRLEPIRSPSDVLTQYPPNSNGQNNLSSFRPISNSSTSGLPSSTSLKPTTSLLNTGGDT